jgi:hypothetical protein
MSDNYEKNLEEIQVEELIEAPVVEETKSEEIASELGIEASISEVKEHEDDEVISSPEKESSTPPVSAIQVGQTGAILSGGANKKDKPSKKNSIKEDDTVAVHSTKNLHSSGLKSVYKGFNIVSKKHADAWIAKRPNDIRLATPEEVAKAFGK